MDESTQPNPYDLAGKLAHKIAAAAQCVSSIPKTGHHSHFGYSYTREVDAVSHLREALLAHGVAFSISMLGVTRIPTGRKLKNGDEIIKTETFLSFELMDTETGYSKTTTWFGEAEATDDKGIQKATTSAVKWWLLKNFLVPSEESAESGYEKQRKEDKQTLTAPVDEASVDPQLVDVADAFGLKAKSRTALFAMAPKAADARAVFGNLKETGGSPSTLLLIAAQKGSTWAEFRAEAATKSGNRNPNP